MEPPKRSISPSPESSSLRVEVAGAKFSLKTRILRHLWLWVGPFVLSGLAIPIGYVRGYVRGLNDALEKVARIEQGARTEATKRAALEARVETAEADINRAFMVNRDQDKRLADQARLIERAALIVKP